MKQSTRSVTSHEPRGISHHTTRRRRARDTSSHSPAARTRVGVSCVSVRCVECARFSDLSRDVRLVSCIETHESEREPTESRAEKRESLDSG